MSHRPGDAPITRLPPVWRVEQVDHPYNGRSGAADLRCQESTKHGTLRRWAARPIPKPTSGGSVKCHHCETSPAFIRPTGHAPASPALCRDCLVRLTKHFNDNIVESTGVSGGESPESFDVTALWEHFDAASDTFRLLHGFDVQVERGEETISSTWKCDSPDRPSTRVDVEVALVKAYLERCGYHRVIIVKGIDTDLAARGS